MWRIAGLEIRLSIQLRCWCMIWICTRIVTIASVYRWWAIQRQVYSSNRYNPWMEALRDREGFKQVCSLTVEKPVSSPFILTGDRLLAINHKNIDGMAVQDVADAISAAPNPCRLKLSRQGLATANRKDRAPRPTSMDGDSFLQQQKYRRNSLNRLAVGSPRSLCLCTFSRDNNSR